MHQRTKAAPRSKSWWTAAFFSLVCGCGGAELPTKGALSAGPLVPSLSTLSMDLSFAEGGLNLDRRHGAAFTGPGSGLATGSFHAAASTIVATLNATFAVPLTTPADLLAASASVAAKARGEKSYLWSYHVTSGGRRYTANLTASYRDGARNERSSWTMLVTASPVDDKGCCLDFKLFDGVATGPGKGSWQIYDAQSPREGAKLLSIDYDVESPSSKTITYTLNSPRTKGEPWGLGSKLTYTTKGDDLRLVAQDSADVGGTTIRWHRLSKAGSIVDKSGTEHCWSGKANHFRDLALCSK